MLAHTDLHALRMERQRKHAARIARLREKADRLQREADAKMAAFNHHRQDVAWLTQPALPNSPFAKQRQRIVDRYSAGLKLAGQAHALRKRADELERSGPPVKGDAEREREAKRCMNDLRIMRGVRIRDAVYGTGTVARVNRKTYTVDWDTGSRFTVDKANVERIGVAL